MNGDVDEAEKIAKAMMPGPVSEGLQPFFEQLAGLSAVNRAFAVHFGELRPTATRIADAKLAPTLPALTTETAPTRLASAEPSPTDRDRKRVSSGKGVSGLVVLGGRRLIIKQKKKS